ncbi:MAG: glycosyltransferase family 2 protein [Kiritimatiellae bacterium]|nr:glycosyltransferase family 2 protein [Kiritimatiellia bacterium]
MTELSVITPCRNEEACVEDFAQAVEAALAKAGDGLEWEIVFVDDDSTDSTLEKIKAIAARDARVKYVSFSRNFGKEAALLAGLRKAKGRFVATMDVDLQDPPHLLPEMLEAVRSGGWDSVATRRVSRKGEPPIRSFFARMFYRIMAKFSDVELVDGARDYRMMTRRMVEAILSMPETCRFTKGIYQWVGFKTKWIGYENVERAKGETKWSFWKLFAYAIDGIVAFTTAPLQVASCLGAASCLVSFAAMVFIVVRKFLCGDPVAGWPSLVCIILFIGGLQIFFAGILGAYLAKTYRETKRRPLYFVREESL